MAPKGARHSWNGPDTRPRPPAGRGEAERGVGRLPHRAEAQDVPAQAAGHGQHGRDHRPARSRQVAAAVDPRRVQPQRLLDRGDAALAHAHPAGPRIGGQPVDVVEREARVLDRGEAGVDREGQRVHHQPAPDRRPAHPGQHRPVLEAVVAHRRPGRGAHRLAHPVDRVGLARRLEQRQPHVLVRLEADHHLLPDVHVPGLAPDDVGREAHRRVLGQRHDGDDVGRLEPGQPPVAVDRERHDRAAARHDRGGPRPAAARRAHGHRRVDERLAVLAALDPEPAVGPRGPEPLVDGGELGERPHRQNSLDRNSTAGVAGGNDPLIPALK